MRLALSFLFLIFFSVPLFAQNWRTVNPYDTVYFRNTDPTDNAGIVRMITIDSVRQNNGDSLFYFFRSVRGYELFACADTAAPSWMGARCQRKPSGTEFYFNAHNDTIRINTRAALADSWIVANDTLGNDYYATVTSVDSMTIDGVLDSVKTCSIQAMNGNGPFSNYNNSLSFKWSKNHGWVNALDWYAFPNITQPKMGFVLCLLPFVFERLPMTFNAKDFSQPDLLWKYTQGNEWFNVKKSGSSSGAGPSISVYTYDSVINSTAVNANTVIATVKEIVQVREFNYNGSLDTVYTTNNIKTDTVTVNSYNPVRANVFPEMKDQTLMGKKALHSYTLNPFCGDRNVFSDTVQTQWYTIASPGSCPMVGPNTANPYWARNTYLDGFGEIAATISEHSGGPGVFTSEMAYTYLKLGNCVMGSKDSMMQYLGVNDVHIITGGISISPNPATNIVNISVPETSVQLAIYDMVGRVVRSVKLSSGSNTLSIGDMPPGLYLLRFSGNTINYSSKLIKK
ncbi:T9SS type A sorting domain-containing protein [Taibaiella soli]|uniref:Secretion system C-terminal sorting domain-containing protein n=1 Tax=Taibaiella soli TaxID=1649169 RepID=A0A2W2B856_9BACT|nr:T9SS type A sorting domain-containing protein [Taibaiella soli]PZF72459.1 hypothetical protein DN068_14005 [Taibaiella soli]